MATPSTDTMRVIASPEAVTFIRERGGRLYLRKDRHRCCGGGFTLLDTSTEAPQECKGFDRIDAGGFELFLDRSFRQPPEEIHVKMRGWRKRRVEAYWNGCAYVM